MKALALDAKVCLIDIFLMSIARYFYALTTSSQFLKLDLRLAIVNFSVYLERVQDASNMRHFFLYSFSCLNLVYSFIKFPVKSRMSVRVSTRLFYVSFRLVPVPPVLN